MSIPFKKFFIVILAATLPLCGCYRQTKQSQISQNPQEEGRVIPSETEDSSPQKPSAPIDKTEIDESVWDLSDVDISAVDPTRKLISFTFDDAPSHTLENIFAVFAAYNEANPDCKASATVFFNGKLFNSQTPHLLATARTLNFELGNHTFSHYDLTTIDEATLREEIDKTDELLCFADDKPRHLLRAPFGKTNELVKAVSPVPLIDWTIDTLDWTGVSADTIYRTVFDNRFSGAIVLMHDGYRNTVEALKRLLPDLKADGYQIVGVSQLAKAHGCTLRRGKTYIRARKQSS